MGKNRKQPIYPIRTLVGIVNGRDVLDCGHRLLHRGTRNVGSNVACPTCVYAKGRR